MFPRSLRYRIALTIFLLEGLLIAFVLWQTLSYSHDSNREQLVATENATVALLSNLARPALLTEEYGELQPYFEVVKEHDASHITTVWLLDHRNRIVSSSNPLDVGQVAPPRLDGQGKYWRVQDITNDNGLLGHVAIQFSTQPLRDIYADARNLGIQIALVGMVMIALIGMTMGFLLTRRLARLTRVAEKLAHGDWTAKAHLTGHDEVAHLGQAFDLMADKIHETLQNLQAKEHRLTEAQRIGHIGNWDWDLASHQMWWSNEMYRIFGLTQERAVTNETRLNFVHPDDRESVTRACDRAFHEGRPFSMDYRIVLPDGVERTVHEQTEVAVDSEGSPIHMTGTIQDITERKLIEHELRKAVAQIRNMANRLTHVTEAERRRMARELHDEFGQALTGLKFHVCWLEKQLAKNFSLQKAQEKLQSMSSMIDAMVASIRRLAVTLRPSLLDDLGLVPALEWLIQEFEQRTGIHSRIETDRLVQETTIGEDIEIAVFRLSQEFLTNVTRHAHASQVTVSLTIQQGKLILRLEDNGRGITDAEIIQADSLGIRGMKERTLALGGQFRIEGHPGKGTRALIHIPLSSPMKTILSRALE